jgi:hypothetical protein
LKRLVFDVDRIFLEPKDPEGGPRCPKLETKFLVSLWELREKRSAFGANEMSLGSKNPERKSENYFNLPYITHVLSPSPIRFSVLHFRTGIPPNTNPKINPVHTLRRSLHLLFVYA